MAAPTIQTYHCLCTHLVLASTHSLTSLPHRSSPGLDKALILPLPPPPQSTSDSESSDSEGTPEAEGPPSQEILPRKKKAKRTKDNELGYSLILAMTLDRKPVVVRREDGFEKRYLWRCGRCRLVVGYQLDDIHYTTTSTAGVGKEGDGKRGVGDQEGKGKGRAKVVYLLPGGLLTTEDMKAGKVPGKEEVELMGE
ncbi:MAG: hypothetical protein M1836_006554 [Candelina mexicana]|nr:MAG: hypothetical protein M1836_006554 [Candelina mexicana]